MSVFSLSVDMIKTKTGKTLISNLINNSIVSEAGVSVWKGWRQAGIERAQLNCPQVDIWC